MQGCISFIYLLSLRLKFPTGGCTVTLPDKESILNEIAEKLGEKRAISEERLRNIENELENRLSTELKKLKAELLEKLE